jgi:hypothetical protein
MGLELFLRFPREKPSLTREGEIERGQLERSIVAKLWWWWGLSWKIDSIGVWDSHGSLFQFRTTCTDLR